MRHLLTILSIFWCGMNLSAQAPPPFEKIGVEKGLSQGAVNAILQDRDGFIWASTQNGINRYDGQRFRYFGSDPRDSFSLSGNMVIHLLDVGDYLLVGTQSNGVNIFDKQKQRFYRLPFTALQAQSSSASLEADSTRLPAANVLSFYMDHAGNFWVVTFWTVTEGGWISRMELPTGFWEKLSDEPELIQQIRFEHFAITTHPHIHVRGDQIYHEQNGVLLVLDQQQKKLDTLHIPGPGTIRWNLPAPNGRFTLLQTKSKETWYCPEGGTCRKVGTFPMQLIKIEEEVLWFHKNDAFLVYPYQQSPFRIDTTELLLRIPTNPKRSKFYFDKTNNLWISRGTEGLLKYNANLLKFRRHFTGISIMSPPGLTRSGTYFYTNVKTGLHFKGRPDPGLAALQQEVVAGNGLFAYQLCEDDHGHYWMPTARAYTNQTILLRANAATGQVEKYQLPFKRSHDSFTALDPSGFLWLATDSDLVRVDSKKAGRDSIPWQAFPYQNFNLKDKTIYSMARTGDGSWWLATDIGLVRGKPQAGKSGFDFQMLQSEIGNANSLRHSNIASLLTDTGDPNLLWIGTKGGGLNRLDIRSGKFWSLTEAQGLPDNTVYGVLPGAQGDLWLSTNRGLVRYTPASGQIKILRKSEGLQDDEFNTGAYALGPDGQLLFAGVNGLNVFHPEEVIDNTTPPNTLITGLKVNLKPVMVGDSSGVLTQAVEYTDQITLPFDQNSLTLEFASLDFTAPAQNRFRYYLQGAEAEWAHESQQTSATYLNLPPGKYTFYVLGSNNDGIWSVKPATLDVTILPPWYRSWWAYLFYILVCSGVVFFIFRLWQHRQRVRQELASEQARREKVLELDRLKADFYTKISHELRTPLTVMMGMSERIKQHHRQGDSFSVYQSADLIRRNGDGILRLVNQILDLSKIESGALQLQPVQGDFIAYVKYLLESFHSMAVIKDIRLHFLCALDSLEMDFDPEKIKSILYNLLSNAIKFTPQGGDIYVSLSQYHGTANGASTQNGTAGLTWVNLQVKDTGQGVPEAKLPFIFDRYFQAVEPLDPAKSAGTGIGLALVKELVNLMRGHISVKSKPGVGTTFDISLPVTRESEIMTDLIPESSRPVFVPGELPVDPPPAPGENGEKPMLLIVEDNPDVAFFIRTSVEEHYQTVLASDGAEGIEMAFELVPDIIVSDVMMPQKDGFELCDKLKNDQRTSHIPIVLLTAKVDAAARLEGLRRGADAYLAKPFEELELLVTLRNLVELRRKLQARFSRLTDPPPTDDVDVEMEDAFLQRVREVLSPHLSDADFGVVELSEALKLSKSQLSRKIKALTGISTSLYMRRLRLERGKELLRDTELNVSEVAYEVGFTDPAYFSRTFSEEFGVPPREIRK